MDKSAQIVTCGVMRRLLLRSRPAFFIALLAYPFAASANITNSVPYTNSFEQYSHGFSLKDTNGWYAEETNALLIATNAPNMYAGYLVYGTLPITETNKNNHENHTRILTIDGTVTNAIASGTGQDHYIDMMLLPRRWDEDKPPTIPSNDMKTAMFFDSNGFATVYGKYYNNTNQMYYTNWITMTNYVVGTDQWVRLTVDMRMDVNGLSGKEEWFRVRLDGFPLEAPEGAVNAGLTTTPGAWFQVSVPNGNHSISSLVFSGTAKLDDLQIIVTNPIVGAKRSVTVSISPPGSAKANIQEFETYDAASVAFDDGKLVNISLGAYPYGTAYHLTNGILDGVTFGMTTNDYVALDPADPTWCAVTWNSITNNHTYQAFLQAQPRTLVIAGYPSSLAYSGSPTNGIYTNQFVYNQYVTCTSTVDSPLNTSTTRTACDAIKIISRPGSTVSSTGTVGNTSLATTSFTLLDMNTDDPSATDVTTNLWRWHYENKLDTSVTGAVGFLESRGDGQVNVSDSWYDTNQTVTVTATPYGAGAGSWNFVSWQGATNGCAISGSNTISAPMSAPRDIAAYFSYSAASTQRTLTVSSDYGSPTPATGTVSYNDGTVVTCSVAGSPQLMGDATQYVCSGWTGSGHVPESGSETNVTIRLTEDSTITWNWQQQYRLVVNTTGPGGVDVSNATWHSVGSSATIIATPDGNAAFMGWLGDTNDCTINGNQIQITMDMPRTITAAFSSYGVPGSWLAQYGLTNDTTDPDGDGAITWQEYVAGTDPTNASSVFRMLSKLSYTGSNYISWYGTTNSPIGESIPPFEIYRSTNLTAGWGSAYASNLSRSTTGTNVWWDTNLPTQSSTRVFYRPFITWTN